MAAGARTLVCVDGAVLSATIDGDPRAPWLTCLHALGCDVSLWDDLIPALAERFQILRLDMRGHGASSLGDAEGSLAQLVEDCCAVWNDVGVTHSSLLGLSIGGMIAMGLALAYPTRVDRVVLAACRADAPPAFKALWDARDDLVRTAGMAAVADETLSTWLTETTRRDAPAMVDRARRMIERTSASGYLCATAALRGVAYAPSLASFAPPVRLVVGDQDPVTSDAMKAIASSLSAELVVIDAAAHLVSLEKPAAFLEATLPFLEGA